MSRSPLRVATWEETLAYGQPEMRRRGLLPRIGGGAGFTRVQAKAGALAGGTVTLTSAPTQGNLLVAAASINSNITLAMSSTGWTALTSVSSSTSARALRMFWKIAAAGESATVTCSTATATVIAAEYGAPGNVNAPTENAQLNTSSATAQPTPSVTPPAANLGLVVCVSITRAGAGTWSTQQVNASATGVQDEANVGGSTDLYDLLVASTTGSYSGTASDSTAGVGAGAIAVFTLVTGRSTVVSQAVQRAAVR